MNRSCSKPAPKGRQKASTAREGSKTAKIMGLADLRALRRNLPLRFRRKFVVPANSLERQLNQRRRKSLPQHRQHVRGERFYCVPPRYTHLPGNGSLCNGRAPCRMVRRNQLPTIVGISLAAAVLVLLYPVGGKIATTRPTVTVGGVPATVTFAGLHPVYPGLYLVYFKIPSGVPKGNTVPIQMQIGGLNTDPANVTIAIQ